jgi:hypothetical protein
MRTPALLHLPQHVPAVIVEAEHVAAQAAHRMVHEADRALDFVVRPLAVSIDLEGILIDEDLECWD